MQLKSTLALLAAASTGLGFVLPNHLEDGLYSVSYDPATGEATSDFSLVERSLDRRSAEALEAAAVLPRQAHPLPSPVTTCSNATLSNRADFVTVKSQMESICQKDTMYPANTAVILAYSDTIAYMCNFGSSNRCWDDEYDQAATLLDRTCGNAVAGRVYLQRWQKNYGRDNKGATICNVTP